MLISSSGACEFCPVYKMHTNRCQRTQLHFTTAQALLLENITITSYKAVLSTGHHAMLLFMTIGFISGNDNNSIIITLEFNFERLITLFMGTIAFKLPEQKKNHL